ncbi:unnamed protein product [Schistosoma bovis]|nr:unnamed protein product [Schistosoma bovis]
MDHPVTLNDDAIFVNILSRLPRIFSGLGIACIFFAIFYHFYGSYSPLFIQHFLLFGKSNPQYCEYLKYSRVPKRWFKYFYMTGIFSTLCILLVELFMLSERSYLTIGLFSVHMLILQYLQDLVFRQLAALRSGENKNSDKLSEKKYYPPEGSMFYWVSCPHYILEISIYLSCQLFITPKWIPFSHILFFTICNQLCCIWLNHNWYKNNFPEWASKRAMLIPYVW